MELTSQEKTKYLKPYKFNEDLFELLKGNDYDALKEDIRKNGVKVELHILPDKTVICGHQRLKIAKELDIEHLRCKTVYGLDTEEQIREYVILDNLLRRQLSKEKRAYLNAELVKLKGKHQGDRRDLTSPQVDEKLTVYDMVARETGVSKATVERDVAYVDEITEYPKLKGQSQTKVLKHRRARKKRKKEVDKQLDEEEKTISTDDTKFNRTNDNIEWAIWTWNPVTGCKHGCTYCYARDIAMRFNGGFDPKFHPNRLSAPKNTTISKEDKKIPGCHNVFVCSMADLFGEWVPREWIEKTIQSVKDNPQWTFLFLTKNPKRLLDFDFPKNSWVGTTVDIQSRVKIAEEVFKHVKATVKFLSCEPLRERVSFDNISVFDWLIIGGQSRCSNEEARQPEWEWVEHLLNQARSSNIKIYFKPNLTIRPKEYPEVM